MATIDVVCNDFIGVYAYDPEVEKYINVTVTDNLYRTDNTTLYDIIVINENVTINDSIVGGNDSIIVLSDNFKYLNNVKAGNIISLVLKDSHNIASTVNTNAEYLAKVSEKYALTGFLNTYSENSDGDLEVDDSLDCWVINYDTVAISRRTNYNFNSFAYKNGSYIGANEIGLFKLDVEDGEEKFIPAKFKTGMIKVSDGQKAKVEKVDLYHNSDGKLKLRVLTERGQLLTGVLINPNDSINSNTIHLGQGTEAIYWQFELTNDDVTDFNVDEMKLYVVKTSRNT